jgi:hypothetical protein
VSVIESAPYGSKRVIAWFYNLTVVRSGLLSALDIN